MIKKIRDILQSACRKCEDEALEKLIAEHAEELIDKFVDEIAKIVKGAEE